MDMKGQQNWGNWHFRGRRNQLTMLLLDFHRCTMEAEVANACSIGRSNTELVLGILCKVGDGEVAVNNGEVIGLGPSRHSFLALFDDVACYRTKTCK